MTVKIFKSQIPADFEAAVAHHASEMRIWRAHMVRVAADKKNPDILPIARHVACPRPGASPLVESAVNEENNADYAIVDDGPTPEQILNYKKNLLLAAVTMAENVANHAVLPIGKRRLFNLQESDIYAADAAIATEARSGIIAKAAKAIGLTTEADIQALVEQKRSPEHAKFILDQKNRHARFEEISRAAAQMQSDIEDLTLETIDAWKMPDFPK